MQIFNFSCPFCGDSKRHPRRARGYVLENDKGGYYYYCHKCQATMSLPYLIKVTDPIIYQDYIRELLTNQGVEYKPLKPDTKPPKQFQPQQTSKGLIKLSKLPGDHPARTYVKSRLIPNKQTHRLFYTEKFKAFTNSNLPGKFPKEKIGKDEPRLILPFVSKNRRLVGFQGRALQPCEDEFRYMTIRMDTNEPRVFGMDCIDDSDDVIVMEGPIDSLFIDNAIATAGGDLEKEMSKTYLDRQQMIIVYDNEPRSEFTIKKIHNAINEGYRVCIWPDSIHEKDVNDMIKSMVGDHPQEDLILQKCKYLANVIRRNTFKGMKAQLRLNEWRKC